MTASGIAPALSRKSLIPGAMLAWYGGLFLTLAFAPLDPRIWWGSNVLPLAFVAVLLLTYRTFPLSNASYILITAWLTLHTVAVHYTYPKVPIGFWLDDAGDWKVISCETGTISTALCISASGSS